MSVVDTGPFGIGPFTDGLTDLPPHPPGLGYGSILGGDVSATYGFSPYGANGFFGYSLPVDGGYGGDPYGNGPYGSSEMELVPPAITSAVSLDGFRVEVFFSETMRANVEFYDASNYVLVEGTGAVPASIVSVSMGLSSSYGANSAILTTTGTTLGGRYSLTVSGLEDLAGNPIQEGVHVVSFLALGSIPTLDVSAISGTEVLLDFDQDLLSEVDNPDGVEALTGYEFQTDYPVTPTVVSVTQDASDLSQVTLTVSGQTSVDYVLQAGPSTAISYDASVLPDAAGDFEGTEVGVGASEVSSGLLLSKASGDTYGWNFAESPNERILPDSSYKAQLSIGRSDTTFDPSLTDGVYAFACHISDGDIQVSLQFLKVSGMEVIRMISGTLIEDALANWSEGEHSISLVRNHYANSYSVLLDDYPIITTPATGVGSPDAPAVIPPGLQLVLGAGYTVSDFPLLGVEFESSQTLYTSAWNFIHGLTGSFTGSSLMALDLVRTKYGPLVKNWGDTTLATTEDVQVRVNGIPVEVATVDPYLGEVYTAIPIPRTPSGSTTVEVDYSWFPNPVLPLQGLNTQGLVLNKSDRRWGRTNTSSSQGHGSRDTIRFPYTVVLGPETRPEPPIHIGHRFIGFESAYTASLNSPNTLLLNQKTSGQSKPYAVAGASPESITLDFGGLSEEWEVRGGGEIVPTATAYTLESADGYETAVLRQVDLSVSTQVQVATRFDVSSYALDGVWSGIGFGFHDNDNLYLVGALVVSGLEHVGILLDATRPDEVASWYIGPRGRAEITGARQITLSSNEAPTGLVTGSRFQIVSGSQAGQYTVSLAYYLSDQVVLDLEEDFPADYTLWGNRDVDILFENVWSTSPVTWKIEANTGTRDLRVVFGGSPSGNLTFDTALSLPAPTSFDVFSILGAGELFWGVLSDVAVSASNWSLYRWESLPSGQAQYSRGYVENVDFQSFMEDGWFPTTPHGHSDFSEGVLTLRNYESYGYRLDDPFLSPSVLSTTQARFRVQDWTCGCGGAFIQVRDRKRLIRLATLAFRDSGSKQIVHLPKAVLVGGAPLEDQGWSVSGDVEVQQSSSSTDLYKAVGSSGILTAEVSGGTESAVGEKVAVIRMAIPTWVGDPGLRFDFDALSSIGVVWNEGEIVLVSGLVEVSTHSFDWSDGLPHTYELRVVGGVVYLIVDSVLLASEALVLFTTPVVSGSRVQMSLEGSSTYRVRVHGLSVVKVEPSGLTKTLGVWLGGDDNDLDNWALPRTDNSEAPNSSPESVIESMDWNDYLQVRLHLDPAWGVVVERPGIPLPPWYEAENMATQSTNPTRGWISVEYKNIPYDPIQHGSVSFGGMEASSQDWEQLFYQVYTDPLEEYSAPHHMVLNQHNVLTSGEFETDTGVEIVTVTSLSSTLLSLWASHQTASRVYSVSVDGSILPQSEYDFDVNSQTIVFSSPLTSEHVPVTVTFAPGKPVTSTYLQNQPFRQSTIKLNEGTPPFFKSQIQGLVRQIVQGSRLNDINDVLNTDPDFILNDPFQTTVFENDPDAMYESMSFFEVSDGGKAGQIASICVGPAPEAGFAALGLEGQFTRSDGVLRLGRSVDVYEGGGTMFIAGGLGLGQGELNSTDVLMPQAPSNSGAVSAGAGSRVDRIDWALRLRSVQIEGVDTPLEEVFELVSDAYAPTDEPAADPNPSSTEYAEGAAWYRLVDGSTVDGVIS